MSGRVPFLVPAPVRPAGRRGSLAGAVCAGLACLAALAGCTTPRISVTDASPQGIRFLIRDTLLVPWGEVDEQAASHCGQHDMNYRRAGTERTARGSMILSYDCVPIPDTRRVEARRAPSRQLQAGDRAAPAESKTAALAESRPAPVETKAAALTESRAAPVETKAGPADPKAAPVDSNATPADSKAAAWQKARTATDAWAQCLEHGAERRAREADDPPQIAAQAVLEGCSQLEHAVHEPLRAAGEETPGFQADLHTQAVQRVSQTIIRTRSKANGPVAVGERVADPGPAGR